MKKARGGATPIVTDHGEPVAEVAPLTRDAAAAARMQERLRSGVARPAERKLGEDFFHRAGEESPGGAALHAFARSRRG
jgi:antitoxin (DNA-binding transcriptional repressor) of toxin-antitoxin stability system